jgi:hypothetical protein
MNSSIFSSDTAVPEWGRWLTVFLGTLALGSALVFALVLTVDPYDSGRFGLFGVNGVSDESPRTANASRARDPQFDSAIIGNSTGQLISPSELSRLSGARFVQLTIPGTTAREQLAVLDFFVRHHPHIGALVIVSDAAWCTHDPSLPLQHAFPFWLYGESTLRYLGQLFSSHALGRTWRRVLVVAGLRKRSAPDGYWDYEVLGPREFQQVVTPPDDPRPASLATISEFFPAIVLLDAAIKKLPGDTPIVLVVPPAFNATNPRPGSVAAAEAEACNGALRRVVAGRARSNFINYRVDNVLTRERANFMDFGHYRAKIARRMELGIADSIRLGDKTVIDF